MHKSGHWHGSQVCCLSQRSILRRRSARSWSSFQPVGNNIQAQLISAWKSLLLSAEICRISQWRLWAQSQCGRTWEDQCLLSHWWDRACIHWRVLRTSVQLHLRCSLPEFSVPNTSEYWHWTDWVCRLQYHYKCYRPDSSSRSSRSERDSRWS